MLYPDAERLKKGRAAIVDCPDIECDICVLACGFSAIKRGEDGLPYSDPEKCVGCGGCAAVCPKRAIKLLKDRGDETYEVTVPFFGELPEIDDIIEITPPLKEERVLARVIQAIPKRPNAYSALIRAVIPKNGETEEKNEPKKKAFLVVVDMQKDFVDGALGTKEAQSIVPAAVKKIESFEGAIFATLDTHFEDYMNTPEGRRLPVPHCIKGTEGHALDRRIEEALRKKGYTPVEKLTFGSVDLPGLIEEAAGDSEFTVELIGLCTDICVISNALILKARFPGAEILVDPACCAGVTPALHDAAISVMRSCQITAEE